jgi:hypothetical protein
MKLLEVKIGGENGNTSYSFYLRGTLVCHLDEFPDGDIRQFLLFLLQCPKGSEKGTVGSEKSSDTKKLMEPVFISCLRSMSTSYINK